MATMLISWKKLGHEFNPFNHTISHLLYFYNQMPGAHTGLWDIIGSEGYQCCNHEGPLKS